MNESRYAVSLVFVVALFLAGVALVRSPSTQAQLAVESKMVGGQRWEYCALTRAAYVGSNRGGLYWLTYFLDTGAQVVEVEDQATERHGPAKIIAKLGEEGWEMVGQGPLEIKQGGLAAVYFKRPKQ